MSKPPRRNRPTIIIPDSRSGRKPFVYSPAGQRIDRAVMIASIIAALILVAFFAGLIFNWRWW